MSFSNWFRIDDSFLLSPYCVHSVDGAGSNFSHQDMLIVNKLHKVQI